MVDMRRFELWSFAPWLLAALVAGCPSSRAGEGLVVNLQTDFVPVAEFDYVRVEADGASARDVDVDARDSFARPRRITTFDVLPAGRRVISVTLFRGTTPVVGRRVEVDFQGSYLVSVILSRNCVSVTCGDDETCVAGTCVSPSCVDGTEPSCPRPQCRAFSDCASTTSCVSPSCVAGICLETGDEGACPAERVCVPGLGCVARPLDRDAGGIDASAPDAMGLDAGDTSERFDGCSAPSDCDDGVACTADTCSVDRICVHTPEDTRCAESACAPRDPTADRTTGCLPPCNASTCVAAGCETATCVAGRCERTGTCAGGETCCAGVCALDCATVNCAGRPAGFECRAAADACDSPEVCEGASPTCPPDEFHGPTRTCRPAAGACDVAETCSTGGPACPPDGYAATGTTCPGGSCDGLGACSTACVPRAPCSTGNLCERGEWQCAGAPRCVAVGAAPADTVCRAAAGACDVAETCGGSTTCPADRFASTSRECRPQRAVCDREEMCSGTSAACPADVREPASTVCRNAVAGGCDVAEACTGSDDECPPNGVRPAGTTCRAASGGCDVADTCNGASAICPTDDVQPAGTPCRLSAGTCDVQEVCHGSSPVCPTNGFVAGGTVCRESTGMCDVAETCTGSSASCPSDTPPPVELCNGRDDDCDASIDEGFRARVAATTYSELRTRHAPCDGLTQRNGPDCNAAIHRHCGDGCTTSGFGPIENSGDVAYEACVVGEVRSVPWGTLAGFHGPCNGVGERWGPNCNAAIHRYCASHGFVSGFGPVENDAAVAYVTCVRGAEVRMSSYTELRSFLEPCDGTTQRMGDACNAAIHRYCVARGFVSGFGPIENSGDEAHVTCVLP
jgi:hypothetical protein